MKSIILTTLSILFSVISFAINSQEKWDGPKDGPKAQPSKTIIYIADDLKNGGATGVYRGLEEATKKLGWKLSIKNGVGKKEEQARLLEESISLHPDAIVLGGIQSTLFSKEITKAQSAKIVFAGWHASDVPGPTKDLFVNITTNPSDVAKLAAEYVIKDAASKNKKLGVVIFNDSQYAIANTKTKYMKEVIETCSGYRGCKVLATENISISEAEKIIPIVIPKLLETHGDNWTYSLAINDIYFDTINLPLLYANRRDILNVSAGDGSLIAISRIRSPKSQQVATVAEPLKLQGYQLADELNRAFSSGQASGYISKPILITNTFLQKIGKQEIESHLGFEKAYTSIWSK